MRRLALFLTLFAAAATLPQAVPGLRSVAHAASGGGGSGTTPPPTPVVDSPASFTPEVRGSVAGAIDGNLTLIFRLYELGSNCDAALPVICTKTLLFEEEKPVVISGQSFVTGIGSTTASGLAPSLIAGRSRLLVQWFAPSSPTTLLGSYGLSSTPYALTLVPGAIVRSTSTYALEVGNTDGIALRASVTGANANAIRSLDGVTAWSDSDIGGAAIHGVSSSASSTGAGVTAVTVAPQGHALEMAGHGGDFIQGRSAEDGENVFRVDGAGTVFINDVELPRKGPKGSDGQDGSDGSNGSSPSARSKVFGVLTNTSTCGQVCFNGAVVLGQIAAPCSLVSSGGALERIASGGLCCICSSTRN